MTGRVHVTRAIRLWFACGACLLLPALPVVAQSVDLFGGVALVAVRNGSDASSVFPTDGHVTVPTVGGAVGWKNQTVGFHVEVDLPGAFTNRTPGAIKSGPVMYVFTQRNLIVSGLVYGSLGKNKVRSVTSC